MTLAVSSGFIVAIVALLALDVFVVGYGSSVRCAQKTHVTERGTSLGAIVDTNSGARFDRPDGCGARPRVRRPSVAAGPIARRLAKGDDPH